MRPHETRGRARPAAAPLVLALALSACNPTPATDAAARRAAGAPLHLEELLDGARSEGLALPEDPPESIVWRFGTEPGAWSAVPAGEHGWAPARLEPLAGALRVHLAPDGDGADAEARGAVYAALDAPRRADWSEVLVELSASGSVERMGLGFNVAREGAGRRRPWRNWGPDAVVVPDGGAHAYRLRSDWSPPWAGAWQDPWTEIVLWFEGRGPASVEIVSVTVVPKAQLFAGAPFGVRPVERGGEIRRAIYAHAPGALRFALRVPPRGRLDVALGVLSEPVTFRVGAGGETLFEEAWSEPERWAQRSVDLAALAGRDVELSLELAAERKGSVAFWGAPTVSGARSGGPPNVILYVIDGAGADLMSVYGYNRRTTPFLERLAEEGAVFEHAHTNSAWTKPSTASFMTSLQHSVLGGFATNSDQIPDGAVTMAELLHAAGYQTAVFTSNPFAGSLSGLQRSVDVFRDEGAHPNSGSSTELQRDYWRWRAAWPGEPYWVHFQTTDVHEPHEPPAPFAGLFVAPERRKQFADWLRRLDEIDLPEQDTVLGSYRAALEVMGVDPREFFDIQRGLYDETMAHNDHQIGRLVAELKARGEWERTLFIVAADHGHPAGSFSRFGRGLVEPPPEDWEGALADSYRTRIPLVFVWPGRIPAGRRIAERVSMVDLLPTVLELVGLPRLEVTQGQSLVPLLEGRPGWEPRPVILEQLQTHLASGEPAGHIEMIEGRWAASLEIIPDSVRAAYQASGRTLETTGGWRSARPHRPTTPRLLLYDVLEDPFCLRNVNAEHPELVEEFTRRLEAQWAAHRALAQRFQAQGAAPMTSEQLATLRALGYVE